MRYYLVCCIFLLNLILCSLDLSIAVAASRYSFGNPMVDAADYGFDTKIDELLNGGMPADSRGKFGITAVMRAVYHGNTKILRALLEHGANPDAQDIGGATALHIAIREGHTAVVRILLEANANQYLKDSEGLTAIDYAINLQRTAELYLLRNAAPPTPQQQSITEVGGSLPWLSQEEEIDAEIEYVYSNGELIAVPNNTSPIAEEVIALADIPLIAPKQEPAPAPPQKKHSKTTPKAKDGVVISAIKSAKPNDLPPSPPPKVTHNLIVQEAVRLPDNFVPGRDKLLTKEMPLTVIPIVRAELFGANSSQEASAFIQVLSARYPSKQFHNIYTPAGTSIYVTPFASAIEVESWCNGVRIMSSKWKCKVLLPG